MSKDDSLDLCRIPTFAEMSGISVEQAIEWVDTGTIPVWGRFTTPRSRALGGKSGITRAEPLVLLPSAFTNDAADLRAQRVTRICHRITYTTPLGSVLEGASLRENFSAQWLASEY